MAAAHSQIDGLMSEHREQQGIMKARTTKHNPGQSAEDSLAVVQPTKLLQSALNQVTFLTTVPSFFSQHGVSVATLKGRSRSH